MKKIGIIGGTFNPIHLGHLIIAEKCLEALNLDKILFMPSGNPPHKKNVLNGEIRGDMIKLAINGNQNFEYSDFELKRTGIIYTADTLSLMKQQNKDYELYFILGADSLLQMESWHEPSEIFKLCTVVVTDRDFNRETVRDKIKSFENKYDANIIYVVTPYIDISSSEIRELVNSGKSIKYLVPVDVENYINKNNLYK